MRTLLNRGQFDYGAPMDKQTDIQELKDLVRGFCDERKWDEYHSPKDLAIGAVTEASELLEIFRFLKPDEERAAVTEPEKRQAIADELADVLFFLLRFSERYKFELSDCLRQKLVKNAKKYPVGSR